MPINIKRQADEFRRKKITLLRTIGNNGVTMFKVNNFEAQGFIDSGLSRWKPKQKPDGRKTLRGKTLHLRNLIFYEVSRNGIEFGSNARSDDGYNYPKAHNEGLDGMPKRQFMGESAALNKINGKSIGKFIKNIFK